eukprot:CAMPEP_0113645338 /NCGR_PEP_ID=MMETSP0017_2-20120614/23893_1 /TAXON_ID=2856 /ORGANISM="Cylindrotheca closterium" /LENGTH=340 /DNA_ID=CAMNT_0000557059 /DNA_START=115 /DNA_END=1137 /DNA_ORIENTATION=+ /assembly_acc=CAM_ASM_000147
MNIPQPVESSVPPLFHESPLEQAMKRMQTASPEIKSDLGWEGLPLKKMKAGKPNKKTKKAISKTVLKKEKRGKKKWKKPKGKPNRPLSAYNFFFRKQRAAMLGDDIPSPTMELLKKRVHCKTHGKIGFAEMAREIGRRWKSLDPESKKEFDDMAKEERGRYDIELAKWKESLRVKEDTSALDTLSNADISVSDSESIHSCEKSVDSTLGDAHISSNTSVEERSDPASENETKQVPSTRTEPLSPTSMPIHEHAPFTPATSYYERIAAGTTIPIASSFPVLHQDRLLLQQMMMNQAPALGTNTLFQERILSGPNPPTASDLAFLAQTQYRRQQMIAALFQI